MVNVTKLEDRTISGQTVECGEVWRSVEKCGEVWLSVVIVVKYKEVWRSVVKYGEV